MTENESTNSLVEEDLDNFSTSTTSRKPSSYMCALCKKNFERYELVTSHSCVFQCRYCYRTFQVLEDLKAHVRHKENKPFRVCDECEARSESSDVEDNALKFCEDCRERYEKNRELERDKRTKTVTHDLDCDACGRKIHKVCVLEIHREEEKKKCSTHTMVYAGLTIGLALVIGIKACYDQVFRVPADF